MKSKKVISLGLTFVMFASIFSIVGCGKKNGAEQEIQWAYWDDLEATEDKITLGCKDVIDRFNEDYKGKYHCTPITCHVEDYDAKLNAMIAANKCPDVFVCNPGSDLTEYVDNDVAADLTDIVKTDEKKWGDTFTKGIFDKVSYDGRIMAIPINFAAGTVFYNKALFRKARVTPPRTYAQLLSVCQKLKAANITPIGVACGNGDEWCLGMLAGYLCEREGGPTNLDNIKQGTGSWLDPTYIRACNRLLQLGRYFQPTAKSDSNVVTTSKFTSGKVAMLVQGSWAMGTMNKACGVFSFPAITGSKANQTRIMVKTDNLVMSSTTKNKEAAIALLKYFTDVKAQKHTAEEGGKFPVINCKIDYTKTSEQFKGVKRILNTKPQYTGFYDESIENSEAGDLFNKTMVSIYTRHYTVRQGLTVLENFYKKNIWN